MGMFDSFIDTDGNEYQSKAFGKSLTTYSTGDAVLLVRAAVTEEEYDTYLAGEWDGTWDPQPVDYDVQAAGDRYLRVRNGLFTGTGVGRDPDVRTFDYYGRDITDLMQRLDDPVFAQRRRQIMALVWVHGMAVRATYLNPVLAGRVNESVACLLGLCRMYMCEAPSAVPEPQAYQEFLAERQRLLHERAERDTSDQGAESNPEWGRDAEAEQGEAWPTMASRVPASTFVIVPGLPVGCEDPTLAALVEDPVQTPQHIAGVFVEALGAIRDLDDAGVLFRPVSPRDIDQDGSRTPAGWSGEERFAEYVTALRQSGLVVVGPGWAHGVRAIAQ